jgi:alkanesulfonate monooxygenase SsuD/methylene tetrahydromethanopterin reductase-like flavin-dependent oxidoreductase (luciferase family)
MPLMRFALWPNLQQPWADVLDAVRHAEATGWDGVWVADHFMGDGSGFGPEHTPTLEATAALGVLAGATERLQLGSLVLGTTYRHPAVVAKWAATLDAASGGRLTLGLGAGWQENEHRQYGIELPPVPDRVARFAEVCEITRSLLTEERTTVAGRFFQLDDALCEPKPAHLRLLIGAKGDRMLGLVARYADAWNMWGLPPDIAERSAVLDRHCERIGRDPATIRRTAQALVFITDDESRAAEILAGTAPRATVAGPPERFAEVVAGWRDAGVDEVIVPDFVLGRGARRRESMDAVMDVVARELPTPAAIPGGRARRADGDDRPVHRERQQ